LPSLVDGGSAMVDCEKDHENRKCSTCRAVGRRCAAFTPQRVRYWGINRGRKGKDGVNEMHGRSLDLGRPNNSANRCTNQ
jgi:hypothetical protein